MKEFIESLSVEQKQKLLEALMVEIEQKPVEEPPAPEVKKEFIRQNQFNEDFTMSQKQERDDSKRGVPVNETKKTNLFVDDGLEFKEEQFKTPEISLTERKRAAPKKVDQTCQRCNKVFNVHQTHAREFFVCDKCLRR